MVSVVLTLLLTLPGLQLYLDVTADSQPSLFHCFLPHGYNSVSRSLLPKAVWGCPSASHVFYLTFSPVFLPLASVMSPGLGLEEVAIGPCFFTLFLQMGS